MPLTPGTRLGHYDVTPVDREATVEALPAVSMLADGSPPARVAEAS